MFSLRILGPVDLTREDGATVLSILRQPKRTALLAYLATGPGGTRSRSQVLDTLWAGVDGERSRRALSQALYYLRRSLGKDAVMLEGETLVLDPAVVATDVAVFLEAVEDDPEAALAVYRGDLMEGFPALEEPAFEQWLDGERERFLRMALDALEGMAERAEAAGATADAIRWAERAHALAPYHEAPVRRILANLVAASEPARARDVYRRFSERLREELGVEPSPETAALLAAPPRPAATPTDATPATAATPDSAAHAAAHRPPARPGGRESRLRRLLPRAARGGLLAVTTGALLLFVSLRGGQSEPGLHSMVASTGGRVGIFPFTYRGHEALAYLGEGIPDLIGISLRSLDPVAMLDPRSLRAALAHTDAAALSPERAAAVARDQGAEHYLMGSVLEAGGKIQVTARLRRTDGTVVATVSQRAEKEEEVFELVDEVVRRLVASDAFPGATELERAAALTSRSLPALRHFLTGERLFREGSSREAVAAFDLAVEEDSTFAMAHYRGAVASLWSGDADFDAARVRVAAALVHRDRVSPLEADLFQALDAFLRGDLPEAERLYGSVLLRQPDNVEAWFQLGESRFHYAALFGLTAATSEEAWRRVLSSHPHHRAALIHLSALAAQAGSPALDTLEARLNENGPGAPAPQVEGLRVFAGGTEAERAAFLGALERHPASTVTSTAAYVARYLGDPAGAARIAALLTREGRTGPEREAGYLLLAHLELARGRPGAAAGALARAAELDPVTAERHRWLLATVPSVPLLPRASGAVPLDAGVRLALGAGVALAPPFDGEAPSGLGLYARALAYDRAGGEDGALLSAARLLDGSGALPADSAFLRSLARGLRAERHLGHADTAAAQADLQGALTGVDHWYQHLRTSWLRSLARERLRLAELEVASGDDPAARRLLVGIGENSVAELPYLGPALIRLGEIHERAGDTVAAREAYRRVLALWSDGEPVVAPLLAEVEGRLRALEGSRKAAAR